jgi:hypothetical protein
MSHTSRRRIGPVAAALAALVLGLTAGASVPAAAQGSPPDDRRALVFQVRFAGTVAEASWSTCGEDPRPGQVCTSTDVMAFLSSTRERASGEYNLHSKRAPVVRLFQGSCEVVLDGEELLCVPLEERFGRSTTGTVTARPRLGTVTADATVPVQVWTPDEDSGEATVDVSMRWTGTGPLNRLDERQHHVDRDVMFRAGTRGWQRDCTAVGTVDGVTPPGELMSCQLYRVRQTEMRVLHGRP